MVDIKDYRKEFEAALAKNLEYKFNVLRHDLLDAGVSYEDHVSLFEQYLESDLEQQPRQVDWINNEFLPKAKLFLKYKDELVAAYPEKNCSELAKMLDEKDLDDSEIIKILGELLVYSRYDSKFAKSFEDEVGDVLDALYRDM